MRISVNCPSYKRPKVDTLEYLPFCKVWVDPAEYDAYVAENPNGHIIACKPGIQGNLCRVRNYIMDQEFAAGADVVVIIDDDMKGMYYFESHGTPFGYHDHLVERDDFLPFVEKYSIMADEIGAKMWGVNIYKDPQAYMQYTPFATVAYLGGPFQCFLKGNECRYDERLPLKEDYDMSLQQLNKYRVVLRVNKFHYNVKQAKQTGGCATYRNYEREKEQFELLQKKWGSEIVREDSIKDRSHKSTKERTRIDFNPVIKVPIKGV